MKSRTTHSGLDLTEVSFGCGAIGGLCRAVSDEQAAEVLEMAWQEGIRYFDTAPFYGHGRSEIRLGSFLSSKARDEYVLSTKVGKLLFPVQHHKIPDFNFVDPLPYGISYDYSYDGIIQSYESSLRRMNLEKIDILYVHDLEPMTLGEQEYVKHRDIFLSSGITALQELKKSGKISAYGLGVNEVRPCLDILKQRQIDLILLAGRYTLLDRSAEYELMAMCETTKTDLVIGGVLNSGILATGPIEGAQFDYEDASGDILEIVKSLQIQIEERGFKLAEAALQFPLNNPLVKSVLIGSAKTTSLSRNLAGYQNIIPTEVYSKLKLEHQNSPSQ